MDQMTTIWIKEEGTDMVAHKPDSLFLDDPLHTGKPSLHVKQELELEPQLDVCEKRVVASASCETNTPRVIENSDENCDVSFEESVNQGVVHSELELGSKESKHFADEEQRGGGGGEETDDDVESLCGTSLKCSLLESTFHNFICSFCLQSFSSKYSLIMHVFVHIDGVQPPAYVCKSCGEVFPSYVSLSKHLKMREVDKVLSADNSKIFLEDDQDVSFMDQIQKQGTSKETLTITEKSFNNTSDARSTTHNAEIRDLPDSDVAWYTTTTLQPHAMSPYKCGVCGKCFTSFSEIKTHAFSDTERCQPKCDICGNCFTRVSDLKKHSLIHIGDRPHKCETCGKCFIRLCDVKKHSLIHTGEKPHKCDTCGKCFTRLGDLKQHSLIHTGDRPHRCDTCGKYFNRVYNLKQHILIHTAVIPLKCDICGKAFDRLGDLKKHVSIHNQNQIPLL